MKHYEFWFIVGSQTLYGEDVLTTVARRAEEMAQKLSAVLPYPLKYKVTAKSSAEITQVVKEANYDDSCAGIVTWCHTFSPSKMWINGLDMLQKPWLHFATQYNREIPNEEIDMDFMNLNQAAHGDREHGFIGARLRKPRKIIAGYWQDEDVQARIGSWMKAAIGVAVSKNMKVMRFGDNMRNVAVTEGDKVEVQKKLGWEVNTWAVGDLVKALNNAGIDVEQLLKLLERVMGDDDQSAKLLASIRNFLTNEAFADVRLWGLIPKEDGTTMTEAEARALLVGAFERITGMTVWNVIEALVSSDGDSQPDDGQPSDDGYTKRYSMEETAKPDLHGQVAQLLNALNGAVSLRARLSAKGVLSKIALTLNLPGVVTVSGAELTFGTQPEETYDDVTETVEAAKDELTPERVQQAYQAALEKLGCKNIELRYDEKTGILHIRYAADWETRILPEVTQDSKGRTLLGVCSYTVTAQLNLNDLQYFLFFDSKDVNSRMILPHYGMTAREVTLGQLTLYWVTESEAGEETLTDLTADEIQRYANLVEAVPPDEFAMAETLDRVQATVILPLAAEGTTVS